MTYVELHARSAFSFLEGASTPEALAGVCAELGLPAMALVDRDGVYGAPRFHLRAQKLGLRAHIGSELTVRLPNCGTAELPNLESPADQFGSSAIRQSGNLFRLPLLVASRAGYQNLCRLITRMKLRHPTKPKAGFVGTPVLRAPKCPLESRPETIAAATEAELAEFSSGLICLTGGAEGPLHTALARGSMEEARRAVERLAGIFGRENVYVELQRHYHREQEARNHAAVAIARALHLPLVATNGVQHATPAEREILDVLTAIRHHTTLEAAGRLLAANAERHLKTARDMARLFADLPDAIANTASSSPRASRSRLPTSATSSRTTRCRKATPMNVVPAGAHRRRHARALRPQRSRAAAACPPPDRARTGAHRKARARRLFPDRVGHRALLPGAGHPGAGPRLGRQQRRLLRAGHHRRRSGRHGPALRALPLGRARRVARHRPRPAQRRAAASASSSTSTSATGSAAPP